MEEEGVSDQIQPQRWKYEWLEESPGLSKPRFFPQYMFITPLFSYGG